MEEANRKIEENTSCWHVVYIAARAEKSVKEQFDKVGIENYLPLRSVTRLWNDRKRNVATPVVPGCIFVHLPIGDIDKVKSIKGVSFLLKEDGCYVSISDGQMDTLHCMAENTTGSSVGLAEELFENMI